MATTPTRLMTFAEFDQMPNHPSGLRYELRNGEPFLTSPPRHDHSLVQRAIRRSFEAHAGNQWEAETEYGFRPVPEHEYIKADVILITRERWDRIARKGNLQGAPDLVVEVLSPSHTPAEIARKKKLCFENGTREFWVVNIERREVEVSTPDGRSVTYKSGQHIPLFFSTGSTLAVDQLFA